MAYDALGRYTSNHKPWDHVGNILPDIEHSEGDRPNLDLRPASWLPVKFWDKHYENWMVVMPGQAVALDPDGNAMPAEYGLTGASVVYAQNDVNAGTIDIATGLAVTTTKTVTLSNLTGVRDPTWTAANAGVGAVTSGFMGKFGTDGNFADATRKNVIGFAPYAYLKWAGGDGFNPADLIQHNYIMQHRVAVLCDAVLHLPLVPAQVASETVNPTFTASALVIGTAGTFTRANAQANATGRYNASTGSVPVLNTYPVIAFALNNTGVAKQTARTTFAVASSSTADNVSTLLATERSALSAVTQAGDYWVDYPTGVIFAYSADGATIPTVLSGAAGTVSLTYYIEGSAAATLSQFACVLGPVVPGDFLVVSTGSNLAVAGSTTTFQQVVGQVVGFEAHPRDALDRVRTAYNPAINTDSSGSMANGTLGSASVNLGQLDQMPGSATGGYPDLLSYAGGADKIVLVNLVSR